MRQQYEPSADRIIALYQQLEDDILSAVIRRILKMGYVSEASKHQLEVLQAAGLLYDDIVQLIADRTDACTAQVKALFEDAGVQTVAIDNSLHEAAGALPIDIRQDSSTRQVLEAGYKKTLGTMQNLVSTTATQTQTTFIQTCDRIYMQVSSGAFSYQEAIMNALRALADTGAEVVYPTKHKDRMDVAVRRCVLTGVSQTAAAVSLRQAEDAGCYLMEITAHSGARPDHAKWQGQLVTITGKDAGKIIDGLRVFTLSEIGYGSGEGFKGWNCHHNWHAYYPGFSTPNYTQEELKKLDEPCISYNGKLYTEYEVSQMQRAQERRVRAWKRRCITAQESVNSATDEATRATAQAEFDRSARYLKNNEAKLKDFCRQTEQDRDRFREQVLGFNRSTAQKAVHAAKKSGLTSGGKDGIIKESMNRRNKNIGEFSELKIPMQKKAILNVCKKYNVETSGLRFKIQRDEKMLSMPFYGSTDYDDIGRIDLFPNAFTDEEQLIRTIIHEKCHVKQLKKHGKKYAQEHLQEMEKQAYRLESLYYHILKKRV
ncbi:MAG: phage minor capsid protein [Ruminococcus sp.]|jgi:hypothetical protein|nr:phage minor capsid protein [Ruminococcus sp.]